MGLPNLNFGMVDVRDVARAHLKAGLMPTASGRHILAATAMPMMEIATMLRNFFGKKYPLPKRTLPTWLLYLLGPSQGFSWRYLRNNIGFRYTFDNSYSIQDLGIEYRPIEETLVDQVKELELKGLV